MTSTPALRVPRLLSCPLPHQGWRFGCLLAPSGPPSPHAGFGNKGSLSQCHQLSQLIQHLRAGQAPNNQNHGLHLIVMI